MSAVSQIDPHASAPPPITHPAPTRDSAWKYALEHEGWTTLLVLTDALSALAAVLIAIAVTDTPGVSSAEYLSLFILPLAVPAMLHVRGVYRRRVRVALRALSPMLGAISVACMAVLTWDVVISGATSLAPLIGWIWLLTVLLLAGGRCVLALARRQARIKGLAGKPTLIVGAGVVGATIAQRLTAQPEYGLHPVGFLDENPPSNGNGHGPAPTRRCRCWALRPSSARSWPSTAPSTSSSPSPQTPTRTCSPWRGAASSSAWRSRWSRGCSSR